MPDDDLQGKVDAAFSAASARHNIDERWLRAIAQTESGGALDRSSKAGAIGLMQIMPDTAKRLGIDPRDPVSSIDGAARLLDENLKRYGNPVDAMRAYNAGTDRGRWNNDETRAYPGKVMANMATIHQPQQQTGPSKPVLGDDIYGWETEHPSDTAKAPVLGDDIYGWGAPPAPVPAKPELTRGEKGGVMLDDALNAAGRQVGRGAAGAAHLVGYITSLARHDPNAVSRFFDKQGSDTEATMSADEAKRKNDYGAGVSNAIGGMAGDIGLTLAGGEIVKPAAMLINGTRAGRIVGNIATGTGGLPVRLANNALAAGTETALTGGDWERAAALGGLLGAGGEVAGKALGYAGRGAASLTRRIGDYLDPEGAASKSAPNEAAASSGGASEPPMSAAEQKADAKQQTKAVAKIGAFSSPEKAADAIIKAFTGKGGVGLYQAGVPGVLHTTATRTRDVKLAGLENNMRDLYPDAFRALDLSNGDAYAQHLRGTIGTPEQIRNLEAERSAFEQQHREGAFANEQAVPTDDLHATLDQHIADSRGNNAVKSALERAKTALQDATDEDGTASPSNLWNVRKAIGYGLQQAAASESSHMRAAASKLSPFMDDLAEHIDHGAPGFRDYLSGYSARSGALDSLRFLQSKGLIDEATDLPGGQRVNYSKLKGLIGQIDRNEVSVAAKGTDVVTPEQESRLRTVFRDMRAERDIRDSARSNGSNTFKNAMAQRTKEVRGGFTGGMLATGLGLLGGHEGGIAAGGALGTAGHLGNALLTHTLANRRLTNMEATDQAVINQLLGR